MCKLQLFNCFAPSSPYKNEVVENNGQQENGAGEQGVTEGLAGVQKLAYGVRHNEWGLIEVKGKDEFEQSADDVLLDRCRHGRQGGSANGTEGECLLGHAGAAACDEVHIFEASVFVDADADGDAAGDDVAPVFIAGAIPMPSNAAVDF